MGANVTKTPVEKLKIDETNDYFDQNDIHYNQNAAKINGFSNDDFNVEHQFPGEQTATDQNWSFNYGMSNLG